MLAFECFPIQLFHNKTVAQKFNNLLGKKSHSKSLFPTALLSSTSQSTTDMLNAFWTLLKVDFSIRLTSEHFLLEYPSFAFLSALSHIPNIAICIFKQPMIWKYISRWSQKLPKKKGPTSNSPTLGSPCTPAPLLCKAPTDRSLRNACARQAVTHRSKQPHGC